MNLVTLRRALIRSLLGLLALSVVFFGVAFLPGSVEGNYRGIASSCGCDSITFINLRKGKMMTYHTAHPPAWLSGRYGQEADGSVDMFLYKLHEDRQEELFMKAYPRLLITKFVSQTEDREYWCWKWPRLGRIGEAISGQDIVAMELHEDGPTTREVFDRRLKLLRTEVKIGPNQWAEAADGKTPEAQKPPQ